MMTEQEQAAMLRAEMDRQGVTDPELRAGIAAIAMGESGFQMRPEIGYANTSNSRIRAIFGSRVAGMSDYDLDELKADQEAFFNKVYGGTFGIVQLGNSQPGDGFKFRGRGLFQLTGRANYAHYGPIAGRDLVADPEIANQPGVACAIAVAYMLNRYRGGGWEGMKRAVGNNIADIETTKNRLFDRYMQSGEFNASGGPAAQQPSVRPAIDRVKAIQQILAEGGEYKGAIDGDFGKASHAALDELDREARGI